MVKHNNQVPNQHFRKDWQRYVKTWFNQPARKLRRRNARKAKAIAIAPRPMEALRPIVRCQTLKYKMKVKAGRGFTLDELKAAKINRKEARGLGIAVDHRRKNRSEESFAANVNRLKLYKSKLIVFSRHPCSLRHKKGDSSKTVCATATQVDLGKVFPIVDPTLTKIKARKITDAERDVKTTAMLRKAFTDNKLAGLREKREKVKAEKAKEAAMKKKKRK